MRTDEVTDRGDQQILVSHLVYHQAYDTEVVDSHPFFFFLTTISLQIRKNCLHQIKSSEDDFRHLGLGCDFVSCFVFHKLTLSQQRSDPSFLCPDLTEAGSTSASLGI